MDKSLNTQLIDILKKHISPNENLVNIIMDILDIEKKTAYRRISGEVPFSFQEVITLANHFGFSLNNFTDHSSQKKIVFGLGTLSDETIEKPQKRTESLVRNILQLFNKHFIRIQKGSDMIVTGAYNMLPPLFYLKYDSLTKFNMMRWHHKFDDEHSLSFNYNDIVIPDTMRSEQLNMVTESQKITDTHIIINYLAFQNLISEIEYYYHMGMLTKANLTDIKADLLAVLEDIKYITSYKKWKNGNNIDLYISNINFESSLISFESSESTHAILTIFYINFITTQDEHMVDILKDWLRILKKSSTLISGASDIYRYNFFQQQEKLLIQLDK